MPSDEFEMVDALEKLTGTPAPSQLKALNGAPVRFEKTVKKDEMEGAVYALLGING